LQNTPLSFIIHISSQSEVNMQKIIKHLIQKNDTKIIMTVLDGVGGLPMIDNKTELEAATTPNLDALARTSACGLHMPVAYGITPGSGPGHLGIFGYNPLEYVIGRGILECLGLGLEVRNTDVCIRCNYATMKDALITDRRAGRIPTDVNRRISAKLSEQIKKIDDVEIIFTPGMEHRMALMLRFPAALATGAAEIDDTDPQREGKAPLTPLARTEAAKKVADIAARLFELVQQVLKDEDKANAILMRGFSNMPHIPNFDEAFGLKALAIAAYPMYRGLAKLVGMDTPPLEGTVEDQINYMKSKYNEYDFFFLHVKKPDSYGEDGNFKGKAERISEFDVLLPRILELKPDVLIITGDHSTPALMKGHSWHPVPVMLKSPYVLGGLCNAFSERECTKGELGILPALNLMPLALANALRLAKYGA
jgi:2,3-bisphosphoglycerate-independent phosphoglycerate mutase